MPSLPVTYSVICTKALLKDIIPQFQIQQIMDCEFWCQGLNDSYKVITATNTYLLRIYRYNWRDLEAIKFELDALSHLQNNGVNVAYPIKTTNGDYIVTLASPEGLRYAILTSYINGNELDFSSPKNAIIYAQYMAHLHLSSKQFNSQYQRFTLDVKHLITEPLQRIKPFLKHRQDDWVFINNCATRLTKELQVALEQSQDIGLCHGDLSGGNAHLDGAQLSSFDFDCCGFGLRVYDLAVFKWALMLNKKQDNIWQEFLQSYQQLRPLATNDLKLIDTLVSIRHIWLIGLHIEIAVAKGWLNESYFDKQLDFLREVQQSK